MLFASCTPKQICETPPAVSIEKDTLPQTMNNLETDVYLDATLSMQGFITDNASSYYQQTLPLIESAVIGRGPGRKINFFRFGNGIENLVERKHLEADKKSFYNNSSYNTKTLIENVIDKSDISHLTVIVTDLFQDKSDINQLSDKVKNKFIVNSYVVGILAIKSQFSGKVFDVGTNNYSFDYASSDDSPMTFRPFYIIVFGPHQEITGFLDSLEAGGISRFPLKERLLLSPYISKSSVNLSSAKIIETKSVNEVTGVLVRGNADNSYREFKIIGKPETANFTLEMPFTKLADVVEIGEELMPVVIESATCNSNAAAPKENGSNDSIFSLNKSISNAINISSNFTDSNSSIQMKVEISPNRLSENSVDGFHIVLKPKNYSLPEWVNDWNMSSDQIEAWRKNPSSFDGTKTYNLSLFLSTLWNSTQDINPPKVADFYCYFKRS